MGAAAAVSARTADVTRRRGATIPAVGWGLYAAGWSLGWLLLWSTRRLPPATHRPAVAVVVPARDEEGSLAVLLALVRPQLRAGDELVVVDDHSTDGTAAVARSGGAVVVPAPDLPPGWVGKPHACAIGARSTTAPVLVFLDADVRPGPALLDGLAGATTPGAVVSVQPWHDAVTAGERVTLLANATALMGCAAFTVLGTRVAADVAFGPVLAIERATYDAVGGHAHPTVRASLTEDIALARLVDRCRLYTDRRDATFRMYPRGLRQSLAGWSRTMAAGVAATRWWVVAGVVAWMWSLAGGPFTGWAAYPLSALQVWVLGRRAGRVGPVLAALYPVLVVALVVVVVRAGWLRVRGTTTWKGRPVAAA
jgi:4,4'-diaponeurosporenoate glycosyltransferase